MSIVFRPATPADIPAITHVRTSVTENHLSVAQMAERGITEAFIEAMMLATPCAWVAERAGQVVGFSMVENDSGGVWAAFVLPGHEGLGIGTGLMELAEEQLFKAHARIWLETGARTRAAGFYRARGWGEERLVKEDYLRLEKRRPPQG